MEPSPAVDKTPDSTGPPGIPGGLGEWAGAAAQRVEWSGPQLWWRRRADQVHFPGEPSGQRPPLPLPCPGSRNAPGGPGVGEAVPATGATLLGGAPAHTPSVLSCLGSWLGPLARPWGCPFALSSVSLQPGLLPARPSVPAFPSKAPGTAEGSPSQQPGRGNVASSPGRRNPADILPSP